MNIFFVFIAAVVIQGFVSMNYRRASAVLGFVITTGFLVYGLVKTGNNAMIPIHVFMLDRTRVLIVCAVWYLFDVIEAVRVFRK
jgi:hypothetical protein